MDDSEDVKNVLEDFLGKEWEVHLVDREKQKAREDILKEKLPISGDCDGIPKKNAWIVFISDENSYITDLEVYELDETLPFRWEKTVEYVERKSKERKILFRDFGCVNSDWNAWEIKDVLFKLGCQYGFRDRNIMVRCMKNLSRIKEFKDEIENWLRFLP